MQTHPKRTTLVVLMAVIGTLSACSSQPDPQVSPTRPGATAEAMAAQPRPEGTEPDPAGPWAEAPTGESVLTPWEEAATALQTIYFDYDQAEIRPDQRVKLQANAQFLREHDQVRVLIAGHCDERGTREYNMALGEQRASAAMQYLAALGIAGERIDIISFGEEQPSAPGQAEPAWSLNRRAEFRPIGSDN